MATIAKSGAPRDEKDRKEQAPSASPDRPAAAAKDKGVTLLRTMLEESRNGTLSCLALPFDSLSANKITGIASADASDSTLGIDQDKNAVGEADLLRVARDHVIADCKGIVFFTFRKCESGELPRAVYIPKLYRKTPVCLYQPEVHASEWMEPCKLCGFVRCNMCVAELGTESFHHCSLRASLRRDCCVPFMIRKAVVCERCLCFRGIRQPDEKACAPTVMADPSLHGITCATCRRAWFCSSECLLLEEKSHAANCSPMPSSAAAMC